LVISGNHRHVLVLLALLLRFDKKLFYLFMFEEPISTFIVMLMCYCGIGCQHSTLNRLSGSMFSWYDVITCKK